MTTRPDPFTALEAALDTLIDALVSGRPELVLAAEAGVQSATHALAELRSNPGAIDARELRLRARAIQEAIFRCRALGVSADALRRVMIPGLSYSDTGQSTGTLRGTLESKA